MPDASVDATLNALVAAGFGAAGQRCMALSTAVFVGGSKQWYMVQLCFFFHTSYRHGRIFRNSDPSSLLDSLYNLW